MPSRFILSLGLGAALLGFAGQDALAANIVVDPANLDGWGFAEDNSGTTGAGSYVTGPATAPLGTGSAQLSVGDSASGEVLFNYNSAYTGLALNSITALSYSTYVDSNGDPDLAPALDFNVDPNAATSTYDGRLIFEPYYTGSSGSPIVQNQWQTWDAFGATTGGWWFSNNTVFANCTQANPCTWAQVMAFYPDLVTNENFGGLGFKVGGGWPAFTGNVDDLTLGIGATTTTFDFDPNPAAVPEPGTLAIVAVGLLGVVGIGLRRRAA